MRHLLHPEPVGDVFWSYLVLCAALLFEGAALAVALHKLRRAHPGVGMLRALRRSKDPSVFLVVGEDAAAVAGLLLAFAGVLLADRFGLRWADGVASIAIGVVLATVAVLLAIESRGLLIGESADRHVVEDIERLARRERAVVRVGRPLTMHLGPRQILLNVTVELREGLSGDEVLGALGRIQSDVRARHPTIAHLFIEPVHRAGT